MLRRQTFWNLWPAIQTIKSMGRAQSEDTPQWQPKEVIYLESQTSTGCFESDVLPHLDAAYNLARWLTRNEQDAEDLVQEGCLRAFRFFEGFHSTNARAWLLKIIRNTFYSELRQTWRSKETAAFDEEIHSEKGEPHSPETLLLQNVSTELVRKSLAELPLRFREVLILRELEGLSYREIAKVADIPLGSVMSSLSRGRERLRQSLATLLNKGTPLERSRDILKTLKRG
jgi:RNA polymerase sigma factor (sigma-70 family)